MYCKCVHSTRTFGHYPPSLWYYCIYPMVLPQHRHRCGVLIEAHQQWETVPGGARGRGDGNECLHSVDIIDIISDQSLETTVLYYQSQPRTSCKHSTTEFVRLWGLSSFLATLHVSGLPTRGPPIRMTAFNDPGRNWQLLCLLYSSIIPCRHGL